MFEFTKLIMLSALMVCMAKVSDDLTALDDDSLHSWITAGIAIIDFFMVIIPGLILAIITLPSNEFPQEFSITITVFIVVEFVYMLFVYGKVIPGYMSSGKVVPRNKEVIKID